jgi:uncharacterized protein YbjT (DUF2867 family)
MSTSIGQPIFVVTGITGQVGGVVARTLLAAGKSVRAVVRSADKGAEWARRGCQIALAEMADADALTAAFTGASAVFVLLPPFFAPSPGFPEARVVINALKSALSAAHPQRIVVLSTVGAQAKRESLLTQLGIMEQTLGELPIPIAFLRAAWFMENSAWDVEPAAKDGVISSFLQPLDKAFPMVATADIGRVAAELLQEQWTGRRIVELEGPRRVTPSDIAATFAKLIGKPVRVQAVPRQAWPGIFASMGPGNFEPRMQMLDGFNEGWICFEGADSTIQKGTVALETVLKGLVAKRTGAFEGLKG